MSNFKMHLTQPHEAHPHRAGPGFFLATWSNGYDYVVAGCACSRRLARAKLRRKMQEDAALVAAAKLRARSLRAR